MIEWNKADPDKNKKNIAFFQSLIPGKISNIGRFEFIFGVKYVESNTKLEEIG